MEESTKKQGLLSMDSSKNKNDEAFIHFTIQHGITSTIEELIQSGVNLNVNSSTGGPCLHEAIKLCYSSGNILQETETLKKISDDFYNGGLSSAEALVFYLLQKGAKVDVQDEKGNLPIHYAKDEIIKQMIFSRLPSLADVHSHRDESSTPTIASVGSVNSTSHEIRLEDQRVTMFIPPEAVHQRDRSKITLTLLRDAPSGDIQENESVACYGIRCEPPDIIFSEPVKITIPHSTIAVNPDRVKPDIVCYLRDSVNDLRTTSRKRSSDSPDEPPHCKVYERHIELYIGCSAEWWVLLPIEQHVIRHQFMCIPYIPEVIKRGQKFDVRLDLHSDLPGIETVMQEHHAYRKCHRSVPFSVESKSGEVTVECQRGQEHADGKILSLTDVLSKMNHNIVLSVYPSENAKFSEITITIAQEGKLGVLRSFAFIITYTDEIAHRILPEPSSFAKAREEVSKGDLSDIGILTIAHTITINLFYDFGVALGFTIKQLDAMEYSRSRDRHQAMFDMLKIWRDQQQSAKDAGAILLPIIEYLDSQSEGITIKGLTV